MIYATAYYIFFSNFQIWIRVIFCQARWKIMCENFFVERDRNYERVEIFNTENECYEELKESENEWAVLWLVSNPLSLRRKELEKYSFRINKNIIKITPPNIQILSHVYFKNAVKTSNPALFCFDPKIGSLVRFLFVSWYANLRKKD